MHFIDRGDHLKRRKEIYELLHPETKAGIAQALSTNKVLGVVTVENTPTTVKSFVEDTAAKAGLSESVIKQEIQMSKNFTPEMKQQVKKADLSKTEALKLARLEPEKQKAVIEKDRDSKVIDLEKLKKKE